MTGARAATVKERAELALNNEFLRKAVRFTTERLRSGKKKAAEEHGNWEDWRERGRQIRLHTIAHLDYYLNLFADNARANGVHVHFAETAAEAVKLTLAIAERKSARSVVKSKSMVTEELHLNQALESIGVEAIETDLGEYIIQLAGETPSHIIIPAIHKNRYQVAELLSKEAGETLPPETSVLAGFVRKKLREKFLEADIGMTGCNFAIAETGSMVLFENEGNARMVSTVPKTQITLMGMERIIPSWADLEVMATLLPRSATGQKLTVYMSGITGPKRSADADGPEEMHIIIIDNGRSLQLGDPEFQELLNCIRCGACLNACPVYRHIGGHSYGGTYSGPIGAVLTPALKKNVAEWDDIANASSLCGACYEACPVKIPLHDMLVYLRRRKVESGHGDKLEAAGMKGYAAVMKSSGRLKAALKLGKVGQKLVVRGGEIRSKLGPLKGWNSYRVAPSLPSQTFRERWDTLDQEIREGLKELDPAVRSRMEDMIKRRAEKGGSGHGGNG
ncbi:LutB/LldF family L-lactate oxidation iron-sulfur protein [Paenibacillus turpanensis]|uniref:LutB/LldF family L-lactate oxidation iron-sulfur protein n=1 Tax=Paenibacillus turpanensis TaxID=2689078 RepID=UPI00140748E3|nr:LutB/LldF family L-lactate oxidation iron-sulfur protein [Paenibacillus turpanensis]